MDTTNGFPAIHPGEILREDVLPAAGLTVSQGPERVAPDGSRYPCGAQAAVAVDVPQNCATVWRFS